MSSLDKIEHVVVLMLENRSFDCLLGKLYPATTGFDGLTGNEANLDKDGNSFPVWNSPGTDPETMSIPTPDPGELWVDINTQLFGSPDAPAVGQALKMSGFVRNYMAQAGAAPPEYDPRSVMLLHARTGSGDQQARETICGLRPVVRVRAVPDVAEPLLCSYRDGRWL